MQTFWNSSRDTYPREPGEFISNESLEEVEDLTPFEIGVRHVRESVDLDTDEARSILEDAGGPGRSPGKVCPVRAEEYPISEHHWAVLSNAGISRIPKRPRPRLLPQRHKGRRSCAFCRLCPAPDRGDARGGS